MSLDQGSFCPLLGQSSWTCKEGCSTLNITSYSHVIFILKHICVSFVVPHYIFVMVSFLPLFLLPEECEVCPSKNRSIFNAFVIKDHHLKDHPHFECSNFVFMDLTQVSCVHWDQKGIELKAHILVRPRFESLLCILGNF